jgi:hypothetical protein
VERGPALRPHDGDELGPHRLAALDDLRAATASLG